MASDQRLALQKWLSGQELKTQEAETSCAIPRFSRTTPVYDLHETSRWVAALNLICSQHPPDVEARAGGLQAGVEV